MLSGMSISMLHDLSGLSFQHAVSKVAEREDLRAYESAHRGMLSASGYALAVITLCRLNGLDGDMA